MHVQSENNNLLYLCSFLVCVCVVVESSLFIYNTDFNKVLWTLFQKF